MQEFYWLFLQQVQYVHETLVGYQIAIATSKDLFFVYLLYGLIIKFIDKVKIRSAKVHRLILIEVLKEIWLKGMTIIKVNNSSIKFVIICKQINVIIYM